MDRGRDSCRATVKGARRGALRAPCKASRPRQGAQGPRGLLQELGAANPAAEVLGAALKLGNSGTSIGLTKKNTVKKKSVLQHRALHGTGGGDRVVELTEFEERILALMGGEQLTHRKLRAAD